MATTRESIADVTRWSGRLLRIGLRRALVLAVVIAAFATLVIITTRDRVSDCTGVTTEQRTAIESLGDPDVRGSLRATDSGDCTEGEFAAPISGVDGPMERATEQLAAASWQLETDYIAYGLQLWRRCFVTTRAGWEQVQISIEADRGGAITSVRAVAPEGVDACELERREESRIYPPRND